MLEALLRFYYFFLEHQRSKNKTTIDSVLCSDLDFLIILSDEDSKKEKDCWTFFYKTKIETLMDLDSLLPGNLEIISNSEYIANTCKYSSNLDINQLYVKLPKEGKYVAVQDFTRYYLCSQLMELKTVLMGLNAESANISGIGPICNMHRGIEMYMEKMGFCHHEANTIEIKFPCVHIAEQIILNKKKLFYWDKWERLIEQRKQGANYYDFVFIYETPIFFLRTIPTLNELNILYHNPNNEGCRIELMYDIYYYPIEMVEISE